MIKSFITAVTGGCLLFAIYGILGYKGKTEKAVAFVFALVFLLNILSALPKSISFKMPELKTESISVQTVYENEIKEKIKSILDGEKIKYKKISVKTDILSDGNINLVNVNIQTNEQKERIEVLLQGIPVSITNYD